MHESNQNKVWGGAVCIAAVLGLSLPAIPGCGGLEVVDRPQTQPIALADFASVPPDVAESATTNESQVATITQPGHDTEPITFGAGGSAARGPEQLQGEPNRSPRLGSMFVVESLVGQINGRPIYADDFFAPIADRLIALGRTETQRRFEQEAAAIVENRLLTIVLNELFLAEAESALTEQEQMGLLGFMRNLQEETISQTGGVEAVTRRRLLAEEGITLDQYMQMEKDRTLIHKLIRDRIAPRVIVSRRDIEREYQRRYEEFNPPAHAILWRIWLSTENESELIVEVQRRLDAGEPFEEVADSLESRRGGEYQRFKLGPNGLADIELSEQLRTAVADLNEGKHSEAVQVGARTWWLYVARIDQPPVQSLSEPEVQRFLSNYLYEVRFEIERARFIDSLLDESVHEELNAMRDRLLNIAMFRYGQ